MQYVVCDNDIHRIIGNAFATSLAAAFFAAGCHLAIYEEFSATLPAATVRSWQDDVDQWQKDYDYLPDPYEEPSASKNNLL